MATAPDLEEGKRRERNRKVDTLMEHRAIAPDSEEGKSRERTGRLIP